MGASRDDRTGEDLAGSVFLCSTSTPGQEPERGAPSAAVRCYTQMCRYIQVNVKISGARDGIRTHDLRITSALLYH